MKIKCISQKELIKQKFFFLMIVPFFIALMITFMSIARAEWNQQNYEGSSTDQPLNQGWKQYEGPTVNF